MPEFTFRFWAIMLCTTLLKTQQVHAFQSPSQRSSKEHSVPLHVTETLLGTLSTGEDVLTSRTIARRIRESRSKRGRVDAPKQSTPTRADPTQHATSFGANHTVEVIERKKKSSNKRSLTKGFHLPYQSTMDALRCYHAVHGNLAMPRRFPVPEHPNYPKEWHGVDLASTVYEMKWWQTHVKQNPDRVAELNKLGFIWERLQPDWNLILEALVTYSSIHGDVMVPKSFNVPHGDKTWPKATWGIHLGRAVFQIRSRNDFMRGANAGSRRAQLDRIGFVWDVNDHLFRKFYYALRHFAKLERLKSPETGMYKPLRVPSTFVVPSGEENGWPEDFWDYPLGEKCNAVRSKKLYVKNNPERQAVLEELGFQWSGNATLGWLEVVHAAAIFSRMNNRNLDAPLKFVVPAPPHISNDCDTDTRDTCITGSDDAWPWPQQLWGLPLGQRLKDIRLKGAYLKGSSANARRAQLDALGFNWTPKRGRRKTPTVS